MRAEWSKPDPDSACAAIAATQYGLLHRNQALAAGLSAHAIKRRLSSGRWKRFMPGVYLVSGATVSWMTHAMAATLWAGPRAALSHRAAAHLWNFDGFGPGIIEVSTPRRLRSGEVRIHQTSALDGRDTTSRHGIRVTSVHRTLIDLGDVCPADAVEDALDGSSAFSGRPSFPLMSESTKHSTSTGSILHGPGSSWALRFTVRSGIDGGSGGNEIWPATTN